MCNKQQNRRQDGVLSLNKYDLLTERIAIGTILESDKEDYFCNISHDKKVLETFICTYCEKIEDLDFSKYLNREDVLAIRLKETGKLIGILTLFGNQGKSVEIGYGIGSAYWNQGYTTEAVTCFLEYLFREKGYETVFASFFPNNIASRRVMEKVGMQYSHTNRNELEYLGLMRDLIYYKISKT